MLGAGLHNLIFQGLTTTGDETSFFDNVSILTGVPTTSIPEPATWLLMMAGFGALAAVTRLSRKQPAHEAMRPS